MPLLSNGESRSHAEVKGRFQTDCRGQTQHFGGAFQGVAGTVTASRKLAASKPGQRLSRNAKAKTKATLEVQGRMSKPTPTDMSAESRPAFCRTARCCA